ncbi:hypothetical protein CN272_09425 [Bacillus anthracis]|uniref:hypothetical protein n=1 Tax=Bacillus TaxID=1386 RepID=UPI0003F58A8E|nr:MULTISPECIES: hypothetical protein [Bacillus cereus group]OTY61136.1 hypothetical protein BK748_06155 [Bacillus thuringiensis serovar graciosensis]PFC88194.1 hypothetical protein CN272_09425 [Bacillus anthracis]PFT22072.1 hypothetical protein COK52_18935 [Bacillus thuringiensis]AXY05737.1 hypothetical protein CUC43_01740 [Bacillus thuringiensis LM1212]KXY87122.1 hypothetical protein AT270_17005 [Bacillus cereus]
MYYYYVPQVYPYVHYYPVYDTSRQYELYRQQQLPQIPSQQPTQDQKPYLTTWPYSNVYYGNYYES